MQNARRPFSSGVAAALLGAAVAAASAGPAGAVPINICEVLVEDLVLPPESVEVRECLDNWRLLLALPHCLLPTCKLQPECVITHTIVVGAEQLLHAGDVNCSVRDLDPAELLEMLVRGRVTNLAEAVAAGIPVGLLGVAQAHFEVLAARGVSLPQPTREIADAISDRAALMGEDPFTREDIDGIRIISDADADADLYLKEGSDAITLGPVVVMKPEYFEALVNATGADVTLGGMLGNASFPEGLTDAIDLMVHELVHVRQYRELGTENFIINYALEAAANGYGNDSFEQAAYWFTARMADAHGGLWCERERAVHDRRIQGYQLGLPPLYCEPFYAIPALMDATW